MKKVIVLKGNFFQRSHRLSLIKKELGEFDQHIFDETCHLDYVLQKISEFSCFSDKRLINIKGIPTADIERASLIKKFGEGLSRTPSDCTVILNNLDIRAKSFFDTIKPVSEHFIYTDKIKTYEAEEWLGKYFEKRKQLEDPIDKKRIAIALTKNEATITIDSINIFFDKLVCLSGNSKKISKKAVDVACADSEGFLINNYQEALDKRDEQKALYFIYAKMFDMPELEKTMMQLIHQMLNRYILIKLIVNYLLEKNNCKELKNKHIFYSNDIWDYLKKIDKLERDGFNQKTRMLNFEVREERDRLLKEQENKKKKRKTKKKAVKEKKKNIVCQFNGKQVEWMIRGFGGKSSVISCYRDSHGLEVILVAIYKVLIKLRMKQTRSEMITLITILSQVICRREFEAEETVFLDMPGGL